MPKRLIFGPLRFFLKDLIHLPLETSSKPWKPPSRLQSEITLVDGMEEMLGNLKRTSKSGAGSFVLRLMLLDGF